MREALQRAVAAAGGQSELARRLAAITGRPIRQGHVWKWLRAGRIAHDMAIAAEQAVSQAVTRTELRPDLYPPDTTTQPKEQAA